MYSNTFIPIPIPLSLSFYSYCFIPIPLPYPFFPLPLSLFAFPLSHYPDPFFYHSFIPISYPYPLSLFIYPYSFTHIPVSLQTKLSVTHFLRPSVKFTLIELLTQLKIKQFCVHFPLKWHHVPPCNGIWDSWWYTLKVGQSVCLSVQWLELIIVWKHDWAEHEQYQQF